jgi:plastocyanin
MVKHIPHGRWALLAVLALTVALIAFSSVSAIASSSRTVGVRDSHFTPKTLTIQKGAKVTWKWLGLKFHNVTVKRGPSRFHSKTQVKGMFRHVFKKAGTYHLVCTIHRHMTMTIVVK